MNVLRLLLLTAFSFGIGQSIFCGEASPAPSYDTPENILIAIKSLFPQCVSQHQHWLAIAKDNAPFPLTNKRLARLNSLTENIKKICLTRQEQAYELVNKMLNTPPKKISYLKACRRKIFPSDRSSDIPKNIHQSIQPLLNKWMHQTVENYMLSGANLKEGIDTCLARRDYLQLMVHSQAGFYKQKSDHASKA